MSNTPSDEELTACYRGANGEMHGKAQPLTTQRIFRAMRAAIVKFGTPPPVVRESSEDLYWELHGLSKILEGSGLIDESRNPDAYTTILDAMAFVRWAQPVAREPLTPSQYNIALGCATDIPPSRYEVVTRAIERAHGITQKVGSNAE